MQQRPSSADLKGGGATPLCPPLPAPPWRYGAVRPRRNRPSPRYPRRSSRPGLRFPGLNREYTKPGLSRCDSQFKGQGLKLTEIIDETCNKSESVVSPGGAGNVKPAGATQTRAQTSPRMYPV